MEQTNNNAEVVLYKYDSLASAYYAVDGIKTLVTQKAIKSSVIAFDYIKTRSTLLTKVHTVTTDPEVIRLAMVDMIDNINDRETMIIIPEFNRMAKCCALVVPTINYLVEEGFSVVLGLDDDEMFDIMWSDLLHRNRRCLTATNATRRHSYMCHVKGDGFINMLIRNSPAWLDLDASKLGKNSAYASVDTKTLYAILDCVNTLKEISNDVRIKQVRQGLLDSSNLLEVASNILSLGVKEEDMLSINELFETLMHLTKNAKDLARTQSDKSLISALKYTDNLYVLLIEFIEKTTGEYFGDRLTSAREDDSHRKLIKFIVSSRNTVNKLTKSMGVDNDKILRIIGR